MKKLFALFVLGALTLSACTDSQVVDVDDETTDDVVVDDSDSRSYDDMWLEIGDLSFYLPSDWSVEKEAEDTGKGLVAYINVPDSSHNVQLKMTLTDGVPADGDEPLAQRFEAKVYTNACGGAYACYYLVFLDDYSVAVTFEVESDEEIPTDLDGVWSPSTEITRDELIDFLLGVALTPEN